MADLLVKLYALPPLDSDLQRMSSRGVVVRRALVPEKTAVLLVRPQGLI